MKTNNKSELWVNVLFRIAICLIAAAFILPFVVPTGSGLSGPDAAGAMASLFLIPLLVVFWVGVVMAGITGIRFKHLRKKYRTMGFSIIAVVAVGFVLLELIPAFF